MGIRKLFTIITSLWVFTYAFPVSGQRLVINELMSRNESTLSDSDGDFPDWIEIWNNSEESLSLNGYSLSDDPTLPDKWNFPDLTISPREYILVFASGKEREGLVELHASFKIDGDGEEVILTDKSGRVIDWVDPVSLEADEVYGRLPDGGVQWTRNLKPTPGWTNVEENQLTLSHDGGFYPLPFKLKVLSANADTVRYSMDGTVPGANAKIYKGPILVENNTADPGDLIGIPSSPPQSMITYKAWEQPYRPIEKIQVFRFASFKKERMTSDLYTVSFFVQGQIRMRYRTPVLSLVTDPGNLIREDSGIYVPGDHFDPADPQWTGNYFQYGRAWEKPCHLEYFEPDGALAFAQEAGMRIHGLMTRQAAQKTLRIYARASYGQKEILYPLLPQRTNDSYKRILLRSTMGSWQGNTVICDELAQEIVRGLNMETQEYKPVVLYLNGEYWGIQTLRDRIDEHYISYVSGADKDSVDLINGNYSIVDAGSNESYIELAEYIQENDLSFDEHYQHVAALVDLESLSDYMISEIFFSNRDWPGNNQKCWRPRTPEGKWRWILFDLDAGFGEPDLDMLEQFSTKGDDLSWETSDVGTFLLKNLLKHHEFKKAFTDRFAELLRNQFHPARTASKLQIVKEQYDDEISPHIDRWAYPPSFASWERDLYNNMVSFLQKRPCYLASQLNEYFNAGIDIDCSDLPLEDDKLQVVPNPNSGAFRIQNKSDQPFSGRALMTSTDGRLVAVDEHIFIGSYEQLEINVRHLGAGIYLLYLHNELQLERLKVLITN